jgi:hypothetical protein
MSCVPFFDPIFSRKYHYLDVFEYFKRDTCERLESCARNKYVAEHNAIFCRVHLELHVLVLLIFILKRVCHASARKFKQFLCAYLYIENHKYVECYGIELRVVSTSVKIILFLSQRR